MRISRELYQIEQMITQQFSHMRAAHALGLALWVYGTVLAKSACLSAVGDHHKPGASPLGCRNASLVQRETPLAFVHSAADRWRDAQHMRGCSAALAEWEVVARAGPQSAACLRAETAADMRQRAGKTGASHGPFSAPGRISPRFVMVSARRRPSQTGG